MVVSDRLEFIGFLTLAPAHLQRIAPDGDPEYRVVLCSQVDNLAIFHHCKRAAWRNCGVHLLKQSIYLRGRASRRRSRILAGRPGCSQKREYGYNQESRPHNLSLPTEFRTDGFYM